MQDHKPIPKKWILLRGLVRSQFHWKNFGETLKERLQLDEVQTLELPGNGFLSQKTTPTDILETIAQLRSQLNFDRGPSFGIIGISLGGMLATQWALSFPREVSHLVLINSSSSLSPYYERMRPQNYLSLVKQLIFYSPARMEKFILSTTSNNLNKWNPQLQDNIEFLKQHPANFINFFNQLQLANQTDFSQVPRARKLILTSKADRLVSYKCSELIAKIWSCDIFYHETAGHDLPLDDPDWVISQIKIFKH